MARTACSGCSIRTRAPIWAIPCRKPSAWPPGSAKLHTDLLYGETGRKVNGIGAIFVTLLCVTGLIVWWPGVASWRRNLADRFSIQLEAPQLGPA